METMSPARFSEIGLFADMAAVTNDGIPFLLTLEHSPQRQPSGPSRPAAEAATLRVWRAASAGGLREVSRGELTLPVATAVAMTMRSGHLVFLAQVTNPRPAYLLAAAWRLADASPPVFSLAAMTPLALEASLAGTVHIPPRDDWSTFGLRSTEWLFHGSLTEGRGENEIAIAMNAADGRAVLWTSVVGSPPGPARPLAVVPAALNPVFLRAGGQNYLFYRKMPEGWSVFFHDLRHSTQFGPIALPLMMARLDEGGGVARVVDLSTAMGIGPVFDFVVRVGEAGLALAVVSGSTTESRLRVFLSDPSSGDPVLSGPRERHASVIPAVPYRLTMTVAGQTALIGLAYKKPPVFELAALSLPLR